MKIYFNKEIELNEIERNKQKAMKTTAKIKTTKKNENKRIQILEKSTVRTNKRSEHKHCLMRLFFRTYLTAVSWACTSKKRREKKTYNLFSVCLLCLRSYCT